MDGATCARRMSRRIDCDPGDHRMTLMMAGVLPAHATMPGENGRIAFRRYFDDAHTRGAIFTIRPNGTGLIQVTHRGKIAYDHQPTWSPNGKWIAFQRVESGKPARIFKVRPDGRSSPCSARARAL